MRLPTLLICSAIVAATMNASCTSERIARGDRFQRVSEARLITLDPGHFHAALVQKSMYDDVASEVRVYAPDGPDVAQHLARIDAYNDRPDDPTRWKETVYVGDDFLDRMLTERAGNVVVLAGNNRRKAEYVKTCVDAGLNVLSDKPMCIDAAGYRLVEAAFASAREKGVLLYDVMTERSEITTILQRELAADPDVFGELLPGTPDEPAVAKESVHHFYKTVSGRPLKRPGWYFDTEQQGEGLVDVTTHLVDLAMWTCFPEQAIDFDRDVRVLNARRWPTSITRAQFAKSTGLDDFPAYLASRLDADGALPCYANGEMLYTLKGAYVRIAVRWDFEAPAGGGDTHRSIMRGGKASLIVRQGAEQRYRPELYVETGPRSDPATLESALRRAVARLNKTYPGIGVELFNGGWRIAIPDQYRVGHEAHFAQVMRRYLDYLADGRLPDWEIPNMLAKYRTTTAALELARRRQ